MAWCMSPGNYVREFLVLAFLIGNLEVMELICSGGHSWSGRFTTEHQRRFPPPLESSFEVQSLSF